MSKIKLYIYLTFIIVGFVLLIYPYAKEKKSKAFEKMALTILDFNSEVQVEYLEETDIPLENEDVIEEEIEEEKKQEETIKPTKPNQTIIKEKYIGVLKIPKIGLERGFLDKTSKNNTVNKNIMFISKSNYPDEEFGNTILAAHSGNSSVSYFRKLNNLQIDDIAYVKYKNIEYKYKLVNVYTQPKTGKLVIYRNNSKTVLTLITCTKNSKTLQSVYVFEKI